MERKFEQHIRAAVEPDARARIADFLKYLVTVSDFPARNYVDACVAGLSHRRDLLTDSLLVRSGVNPIEHVRRRDNGLNSVFGGGVAHGDRFFQRDRSIVDFRQHVAMNVNHPCQIKRAWRNSHAGNRKLLLARFRTVYLRATIGNGIINDQIIAFKPAPNSITSSGRAKTRMNLPNVMMRMPAYSPAGHFDAHSMSTY